MVKSGNGKRRYVKNKNNHKSVRVIKSSHTGDKKKRTTPAANRAMTANVLNSAL